MQHQKLAHETNFSYCLSDWFNIWWRTPFNQSAGGTHGVEVVHVSMTYFHLILFFLPNSPCWTISAMTCSPGSSFNSSNCSLSWSANTEKDENSLTFISYRNRNALKTLGCFTYPMGESECLNSIEGGEERQPIINQVWYKEVWVFEGFQQFPVKTKSRNDLLNVIFSTIYTILQHSIACMYLHQRTFEFHDQHNKQGNEYSSAYLSLFLITYRSLPYTCQQHAKMTIQSRKSQYPNKVLP